MALCCGTVCICKKIVALILVLIGGFAVSSSSRTMVACFARGFGYTGGSLRIGTDGASLFCHASECGFALLVADEIVASSPASGMICGSVMVLRNAAVSISEKVVALVSMVVCGFSMGGSRCSVV